MPTTPAPTPPGDGFADGDVIAVGLLGDAKPHEPGPKQSTPPGLLHQAVVLSHSCLLLLLLQLVHLGSRHAHQGIPSFLHRQHQ